MKVSGRTLIGPFGSIAATACHRKQRMQKSIEAKRFAGELLMPYDMIMQDLATHTPDIEDEIELRMLADKYGVSLQALTLRIRSVVKDALF